MIKKEKQEKKPKSAPGVMLGMCDIARSGEMTRWHSIKTSRPQTIAEHHYLVAMIVNWLAKEIFGAGLPDGFRLRLLELALWHDTPELVTCTDIASPYKRRISQICRENGIENPIDIIEDEIAPFLKKLKEELAPHPASRLLKIADLLDAYLFISSNGVGRHAQSVASDVLQSFKAKVAEARAAHPEFDWGACDDLLAVMHDPEGNKILFEGKGRG
jgi:5'-deoxynucleotidase